MIDPELRHMVEESLTLARENNKLLHKMRRASIWARVLRIIYWVIMIGFAMGAYYFIQPMLDSLLDTYSGLMSGVENIQKAGESIPNISDFLKK